MLVMTVLVVPVDDVPAVGTDSAYSLVTNGVYLYA